MSGLHAMALSDEVVAAEAAEEAIASGASAISAVLTGYFAAAGAHAGVLLGPVTLLLAGIGEGARAFDGRSRQPGAGAKRPRGYRADDAIPDAARVAVPAAVPALLVALGYDDNPRLRQIVRSGARRARRAGADARAALLERIAAVGASAVSEMSFIRPLLHAGGQAEGGTLTASDLRAIDALDHPATAIELDGRGALVAPWSTAAPESEGDIGRGYAILAIDARGTFACLCFRRILDGVPVEELELEAPAAAVPVRRGVPRVAPGTVLPAPAPVAITLDEAGRVVAACADPPKATVEPSTLTTPVLGLYRDPETKKVRRLA